MVAGIVCLPLVVVAGEHKDGKMNQGWQKMQGSVTGAENLLTGEVTDGFNPLGNVRELVLSENLERVHYVIYEVPFPYSFYGSEDGFVDYTNVALERGYGTRPDLRIDDPQSQRAPEELKLTKKEAEHRLASNVMDSSLNFTSENSSREVEDLLVDRKSGAITHFVIEMDPESLFNENARAIPAGEVKVGKDGKLTTAMKFDAIDDMQRYNPEFLK
tara:strand:- start:32770 stop:33417 length:648 start_codon:yes stop_codon:yes gene_type:complete